MSRAQLRQDGLVPPLDEAAPRWSGDLRRMARWFEAPQAAPQQDQLRRAAAAASEFAGALAEFAASDPEHRLTDEAVRAATWRSRLGGTADDLADIYNEIRAALAELNRLRIEIVLAR